MITNQNLMQCWNDLPEEEKTRVMIKFGIREGENPLTKIELKKYLQDHYISTRGVITK